MRKQSKETPMHNTETQKRRLKKSLKIKAYVGGNVRIQSVVEFKPEKNAETYFKKVCIKLQQSFITISKIQNMHFRPQNNLYEFLVSYRNCLYDERFYDKNVNKICKKSLHGKNN